MSGEAFVKGLHCQCRVIPFHSFYLHALADTDLQCFAHCFLSVVVLRLEKMSLRLLENGLWSNLSKKRLAFHSFIVISGLNKFEATLCNCWLVVVDFFFLRLVLFRSHLQSSKWFIYDYKIIIRIIIIIIIIIIMMMMMMMRMIMSLSTTHPAQYLKRRWGHLSLVVLPSPVIARRWNEYLFNDWLILRNYS